MQKYVQLLVLKNIEQRKIQTLKLAHNVNSQDENIPEQWLTKISKYNTSRNGCFLRLLYNRIELTKKSFFTYSIKLFNDLPIHVRNECNF